MALVLDLYDNLALKTGFPPYTNDTDCPEINRFLLEMLSEGLQCVIDNLYISNNVLQRNDTVITTPFEQEYGIEGIIKNLQLITPEGNIIRLPYADKFNPERIIDERVETPEVKDEEGNVLNAEVRRNCSMPRAYCIRNGYLRLLPTPDKEYTLKVTVSTTDLVMADNDVARNSIEHIDDAILADKRFCDLVVLKAATLVFGRCQNPNARIYNSLYEERLRTYLEHDLKTTEAQRGFYRNAGHYRGRLLDDGGI